MAVSWVRMAVDKMAVDWVCWIVGWLADSWASIYVVCGVGITAGVG